MSKIVKIMKDGQEYCMNLKGDTSNYATKEDLENITIETDTELSETSENPVQNKVINSALISKENIDNKVESIDENSTNDQYPSAKCVYDKIQSIDLSNFVEKEEGKSLVDDTEIKKIHSHNNENELKKIGEDSDGNLTYDGKSVGGNVDLSDYATKKDLENITIKTDTELSSTSVNPVQNKVIYTELNKKENKSNKVTTVDSSSTDTQYPSAKAVYKKFDEVFQSVSSGKKQLEASLSDLGVTVSKSESIATYAELDTAMRKISQSIPTKYTSMPEWMELLPQSTIKREGAVCEYYDGYIYVIGGKVGSSYVTSMSIFDIQGNKWIEGSVSGLTGFAYAGSCIADGYLYIIGGYNGSTKTNVYRAKLSSKATSLSFSSRASIPNATSFINPIFYNGYIYATGGWNANVDDYYNLVQIYNVSANTWTTQSGYGEKVCVVSSGLYNGKIYFIGGMKKTSDSKFYDSLYIVCFNPITKTFTTISTNNNNCIAIANTSYDSECIYMLGGADHFIDGTWNPQLTDRCYKYNMATNTSSSITSILSPRTGCATCNADGRIYCIGGIKDGDVLGLKNNHTTGGDDSIIQMYTPK